MWRALVVLTLLALLSASAAAGDSGPGEGGDDDDDDDRIEIRQSGVCTGGGRWKFRLRAEEGEIRIDFEVDERRLGALWRVVLIHERQIVLRAARRTVAPGASFAVRRIVEDWYGADNVVARATGPRGQTCRASATV